MPGREEVPEEINAFLARVCECGAVHDRPDIGCPECGSIIARKAGLALFAADLGVIRNRERQCIQEALETTIKQHEVAARDEHTPVKLELAKAEGLAEFPLDTLDPSGEGSADDG